MWYNPCQLSVTVTRFQCKNKFLRRIDTKVPQTDELGGKIWTQAHVNAQECTAQMSGAPTAATHKLQSSNPGVLCDLSHKPSLCIGNAEFLLLRGCRERICHVAMLGLGGHTSCCQVLFLSLERFWYMNKTSLVRQSFTEQTVMLKRQEKTKTTYS